MPEAEINVISAVQDINAVPEDATYGHKAQSKETARRMKFLFGKDPLEDDDKKAKGD